MKIKDGQESFESSFEEIFSLFLQRSLDKAFNCRISMLKTLQEILGKLDISFVHLYKIMNVLEQRIKD